MTGRHRPLSRATFGARAHHLAIVLWRFRGTVAVLAGSLTLALCMCLATLLALFLTFVEVVEYLT